MKKARQRQQMTADDNSSLLESLYARFPGLRNLPDRASLRQVMDATGRSYRRIRRAIALGRLAVLVQGVNTEPWVIARQAVIDYLLAELGATDVQGS